MRQRTLQLGDQSMTLNQWARKLGVTPGTLHARLGAGWSIEETLGVQKRPQTLEREARRRAEDERTAARAHRRQERAEELARQQGAHQREMQERHAAWELERQARLARRAQPRHERTPAAPDPLRVMAARLFETHPDKALH